MLVIRRLDGQCIEITHRSGDVLRIFVQKIGAIHSDKLGADLVFDDAPRNFEIHRPGRRKEALDSLE